MLYNREFMRWVSLTLNKLSGLRYVYLLVMLDQLSRVVRHKIHTFTYVTYVVLYTFHSQPECTFICNGFQLYAVAHVSFPFLRCLSACHVHDLFRQFGISVFCFRACKTTTLFCSTRQRPHIRPGYMYMCCQINNNQLKVDLDDIIITTNNTTKNIRQ